MLSDRRDILAGRKELTVLISALSLFTSVITHKNSAVTAFISNYFINEDSGGSERLSICVTFPSWHNWYMAKIANII